MHTLGGEVNVLAAKKVAAHNLDSAMESIVARTTYLGSPLVVILRCLAYMLIHPIKFFMTLSKMFFLPHRCLLFRFRTIGMVAAAASVVHVLKPRRFKFIQAHFAAYHTELAMALSQFLYIPFGITAHATGIWKDRNILFEKIEAAKIVSTCTCFNAEHLKEISQNKNGKVNLIYHGLDLKALPAPAPYPNGELTRFIAIGRMVPKKGFETLIDASRILKNKGISFEITFIGEGPSLTSIVQKTRELHLENKVRFFGEVDNKHVFELLQKSHCLVVPSIKGPDGNMDGIPNVILEAFALGRPVIGSSISGIPEVVHHNDTGLLFPSGDSGALAGAMIEIAQDHQRASAFGLSGRTFVEKHFDLERNVKTQLRLLQQAQQQVSKGDKPLLHHSIC